MLATCFEEEAGQTGRIVGGFVGAKVIGGRRRGVPGPFLQYAEGVGALGDKEMGATDAAGGVFLSFRAKRAVFGPLMERVGS